MQLSNFPRNLFLSFFLLAVLHCSGQSPNSFSNPVLPGFHPDPSICRVGEDYYMVTSSFVWFPGIPIYHSKDLVNWELIGHGIDRSEQLNMAGIKDKDGIWAVTIRHHKGLFYLITSCSNCGGNFYITAENPAEKWSDPVWLKDSPGIDPSLFWDSDDKCYYTGNTWDFKKSWPRQCAIWGQELDLKNKKLVGERKILTYGHANNAAYTESPHLYKIDNRYLLLTAEGGSAFNHAVTAHSSNTVLGDYISSDANPVLTQRHLGSKSAIQEVGHADIVETQNGEWWGVVLGKRVKNGLATLSRETFLCRVVFENGLPVFNPGHGLVLQQQERPDLPWTPFEATPDTDQFQSKTLGEKWYTLRGPGEKLYTLENGKLKLQLKPQVVDSLVTPALLLQKIKHHHFTASTVLDLKSKYASEQAGLIIHRNSESYYSLLKEKQGLVLIKKDNGNKQTVTRVLYTANNVCLKVSVNDLSVQFSYGESLDNMRPIGGVQSLDLISDSKINKFNGTGIGIYATANGQKSNNTAAFDLFTYSGQ